MPGTQDFKKGTGIDNFFTQGIISSGRGEDWILGNQLGDPKYQCWQLWLFILKIEGLSKYQSAIQSIRNSIKFLVVWFLRSLTQKFAVSHPLPDHTRFTVYSFIQQTFAQRLLCSWHYETGYPEVRKTGRVLGTAVQRRTQISQQTDMKVDL